MAEALPPTSVSKDAEDEESLEYIEAEPVLTYILMKNDITEIVQKDSVSCIRASHRFLVLGTHWGRIHLIDHEGNKVLTKDVHQSTVNDISIDVKEEYIASCGDDGRVSIFGLLEDKHDQMIEFNRPIKCVELDPSGTFSFVTGDTKLELNEKGFMGRRKKILHDNEGIIRAIKWSNDMIAWCNDKGVKIYSTYLKKIITYIAKDHDANLRNELYRCSLLWSEPDCLIIGWADRFKICRVVRGQHTSLATNVLTGGAAGIVKLDEREVNTYVEITDMVQTDFYICGIAPFNSNSTYSTNNNNSLTDNQYLILCYEKGEDTSHIPEASLPHIRVIQIHPETFEETSLDAVMIRDYERNQPCDYRLDFIGDEGLFFIIGPKDIIKAMPRSFDDHIKWLIERHEFEEALADIKTAPATIEIKLFTYETVCLKYIDYLLFSKEFYSAADWCTKIKLDAKNWEEKILIFAKEGKLDEIYDKIPYSSPTLSPVIYEKCLNELLRLGKYAVLKKLLQKWPCDVYDLKTITNAVLDVQRSDKSRLLLETIAILYEYQKLFDKCIGIHIELCDQSVFDLVINHGLYESAFENIVHLIGLNKKKAIAILVDNVDKLPVKRVVEKLSKNKLYLHYYLDAIFDKEPNLSQAFHTMQVVLYAEYEREKLLSFLKNSQYISLAQAQKELQERNLVPEIVYILERMGQTKKALQLVLHAIKDVDQAIEFCKRHNDKDLWEDLIQFSLNKQEYIIGLLNNVGTHVDPVQLINRIPNGVKIKGLRDALVKILQDYQVQLSLLKGSKKIISGDCLNLMDKQIRIVRKGICIEEGQRCLVCEGLLISGINLLRRMKVFQCSHAYHEDCLEISGTCMICSQSKSQKFGPQ